MHDPHEFALNLSFIADEDVRLLIEDYYRQGLAAYDAEAYLGTLVICGAVIEGILTWVLVQWREEVEERYPGAPVEEWDVTRLIKVVTELGLLGMMAKPAAWAVKDYRNFIHPYKLLRSATSARANRALALNVITAVMEITRSLQSHRTAWALLDAIAVSRRARLAGQG